MTNVVYTGPPAGADNLRAVRHGANTEALLSVVAVEVRDALIGTFPWVLDSDAVGIEQYCRAEARARILSDYTMKEAERKGVGGVAPYLWRESTNADAAAMRAAEALGLTPMGRMKIFKDGALSVHFSTERVGSLVTQGTEMLDAEEASE